MKSILYVGASLMVAASIYGFVDYKQTSKEKEFKGMYTEKKAVVPAEVTDVETTEPVVKTEVTKQTKTNVTKKKVVTEEEDVFPAVKPVPADQKLTSEGKDISITNEVSVVPSKETTVVKKKRKFSIKEFSRAPLRDRYVDEEATTPVKKKELKKLEIKD
ncbi:MAG: hypothetical protein KBF82_01880 [Chitinophagaceae bacterium]|nr:hypothetical protein [Chitinophagaceae bacterium]MBP9102585.1 hypothetical protein [Chitinophagaceae bacterium]